MNLARATLILSATAGLVASTGCTPSTCGCVVPDTGAPAAKPIAAAASPLAPAVDPAPSVPHAPLPDHFPAGKRLRVRVDGGTLSQNGQTLAWDAHGYYEIALDAGSLMLGP